MQRKIPTVLMRGGTSKGLFFNKNDLPIDKNLRDQIILTAFGSPDSYKKQIDGIGGATSTTNKLAIISKSFSDEYDVIYNFGQISITEPIIDYNNNCGNISVAVGPFVVDEGLVSVIEPITTVRILQKNTNKLIIANIPVKDGCFNEEGNYRIAGIPNCYSEIKLRFIDPGGSFSSELFPTGQMTDILKIDTSNSIEATIIDAANPVVIVLAADIGLQHVVSEDIQLPYIIKKKLEAIQRVAAKKINLDKLLGERVQGFLNIPKVAFVDSAKTYKSIDGNKILSKEIDILARIMTMGKLHHSYSLSGAIATVGAAIIPGTIVNKLLSPEAREKSMIKIGHPSGIMKVNAIINKIKQKYYYKEAQICSTARRLMEGHVFVPSNLFCKKKLF